jgi:hypothetical protein
MLCTYTVNLNVVAVMSQSAFTGTLTLSTPQYQKRGTNYQVLIPPDKHDCTNNLLLVRSH